MQHRERMNPALLHDLVYLYLELAHGSDHHLDRNEQQEIAAKLRQWQPNQNPKMLEHVLREATLSYLDQPHTDQLNDIISHLAKALPADIKMDVVEDLADIASADGKVLSSEYGFIGHIAEVWGVSEPKGLPS